MAAIKKNTQLDKFPVGNFLYTANGIAATTGTPVGKYLIDGVTGTFSAAINYYSNTGTWVLESASADETNGNALSWDFTLTDCIPIHYSIITTTKLVSELNDFNPTATTVQSNVISVNGNAVTAPSDFKATGFATPTNVSDAQTAIINQGNSAWNTANGFATPTNVTDARDAVISHGDSNWDTAVVDISELAKKTDVSNTEANVISHGDSNWTSGPFDSSNLASKTDIANVEANVISHGDANWDTAVGFATPTNVTDARDAVISHGDSNWDTAVVDTSLLAKKTDVANVESNVIARGNSAWNTATGFATPTNVTNAQTAIINQGNAAWNTANGFATPNDINLAEANVISHGDANWDTAVVDISELAKKTDVSNTEANVISHGDSSWTTADISQLPTANVIVSSVLSGIVDGSVDLQTAIKVIYSITSGNCAVTATNPVTIEYKDADGGNTIATLTIPVLGTGRVRS